MYQKETADSEEWEFKERVLTCVLVIMLVYEEDPAEIFIKCDAF